jgi:hypothetical protein
VAGLGIVPYGIDYNEVALEVLRREVLPGYRENFTRKDWLHDTIDVPQDVCVLTMSFFRDDLAPLGNVKVRSRYLVLREEPSVDPADHVRWLETMNGIVRRLERQTAAGIQRHHNYLYQVERTEPGTGRPRLTNREFRS